MNTENPTPLRLGLSGRISGQEYRIVGRAAMSTEFGGQTYGWQEFLLQTPSGERATLVYEDQEDGAQWKLFVSLAESSSISLDAVTTLKVGDSLVIEGRSTRVTFTGNSVVAFAEGELPEGMATGVVDQFLNAESGTVLYVISWRPGRLEVFRGMNLPTYAVEAAFRVTLPTAKPAWKNTDWSIDTTDVSAGHQGLRWLNFVVSIFIGLIFLFLLGTAISTRSPAVSRPIREEPAPKMALALGGNVQTKALSGRVRGHSQVQVAKVGAIYQRHDYWISTADSDSVWLIQGGGGNTDGWQQLNEVPTPSSLRPVRAAELRMGDVYPIGGKPFTIISLFRQTFRSIEGTAPEWVKADDSWLGLAGQSGEDRCVVIWKLDEIRSFVGKKVAKP